MRPECETQPDPGVLIYVDRSGSRLALSTAERMSVEYGSD
jgi:hypothetical protein